MDKELVTYFVEQVKERNFLDKLYKTNLIEMDKFLEGKRKTLNRVRKKKINKLWKEKEL